MRLIGVTEILCALSLLFVGLFHFTTLLTPIVPSDVALFITTCFLCAAACPSNCIHIEAAENTAENRISGAERYAKVYNIDYNRCIFCGYCVEACPTDAITHGHGFEVASYNTATLVKRKEEMLVRLP